MYDIVGDIHGYAEVLRSLLSKMGYQYQHGGWSHPEGRNLIFVGDYIDRGPEILEVLRLVRDLEQSGLAIALMGNHELNALAYHTPSPEGGWLRDHSIKNTHQHEETLKQISNAGEDWKSHLKWMMTLPLFWENEDIRVVHACWHEQTIETLSKHLGGNKFKSSKDLGDACQEENVLFQLVENTLKGMEMSLPNGISFKDKDGHNRNHIRVKWWLDKHKPTWKDLSVLNLEELPETIIDLPFQPYSSPFKPVFFGHYWLQGIPQLQTTNVCCVDYSIAKGGSLVAYRWDGEQTLDKSKFIAVGNV